LFELDKVSADQPVAQNQRLVNCFCCAAKQRLGGGINSRDELLVVHTYFLRGVVDKATDILNAKAEGLQYNTLNLPT
jgi:hypothetical protein